MQSARDILIHPDTARRGQRASVSIPLSIALLSAGFAISPAAAQTAAPQATAVSPDAIKQREQELEAARTQQKNAAELQQKLKADIAAIGQDRSKLNQQLIDIAGQVRTVEPPDQPVVPVPVILARPPAPPPGPYGQPAYGYPYR